MIYKNGACDLRFLSNVHMFHCKLLNFILVKLWEFKFDCLHCVSF